MTETKTDRFLRIEEVAHCTGCGKSTIRRLVSHGQFPSPIYILRSARWSEREVAQWMEERANARRAG